MSQEALKQVLLATMEEIKSNPHHAKMVFEAETQLEEGMRCTGTVRQFPPLVVDEPPALGGGNAGMNPVELVLVALGTCQEIMYAAYAAVMGIPLQEVRVDVEGHLDVRGLFGMAPDVPPGYQEVAFSVHLRSPADEATLDRLVQLVQTHCPVLDSLARPLKVTGEVSFNGGGPKKVA